MSVDSLFYIPLIGKKIKNRVISGEGGEKTSQTLRKLTLEKHKVDVGLYTYGSCFSTDFNVGGVKVSIGRYCSFAGNVHYFGANHPYNHAVMSPYFYNKEFSGLDVLDVPRSELRIGHDVWIGYGSIITASCHNIGNGSVIAAGSIVTKDVPAYSIVGGNPARIIKYRFGAEAIEALEKSRWWELTPDELIEFYDLIGLPVEWADKCWAKIGH